VQKKRREVFHFIGIDLAWSSRNPTGLATVRWQNGEATLLEPLPEALAYTDEEIAAYVKLVATTGSVVIAIDAPLTVPNVTGQRPGERALNTVFARFHAGAHPANRQRLASYNNGEVRGEALLVRLAALDIRHDPVLTPRRQTRQAFEAYPHPAMVTLFRLNKVLKYKAKPRITREERLGAFCQYQQHLRHLRDKNPALPLPDSLLSETHLTKKGRVLKAYEDQLDAVFCAYIALYYWWWGAVRCRIFGDVARGYIVAPVAPLENAQ
jgi:predicted RNase H-like nuclease